MITLHAGLVAVALFCGSALLAGFFVRRTAVRVLIGVAVVAALAFIPVPPSSTILALLTGLLWPMSAGTLVAVGCDLRGIVSKEPRSTASGRVPFWLAVIAVAACVYPAALGARLPDIYALGYAGPAVPAVMAILLAAGVVLRSWLVVVWIAAAAAGALFGLGPSANLWDYLVDPLIVVVSVVRLGWWIGRSLLGRKSASQLG